MSEKNRHSVSEELLFRYFLEEVSPEEQERVQVWRDASEANGLEFERIKLLVLDLKATRDVDSITGYYDVERAWKKLSIDKDKPNLIWLRIAATVLVTFGIAWYVYLSSQVETLELVAGNTQQSVQLVDGSKVSLNVGSQLIYPDKFKGEARKVELSGEAYFEIAHNPDQPFVIATDEVQVQVLGTSFNVNNSSADSIIVSVDTGRVLMSVGSKKETLTAGFRGVYYRSTQLLVKIETAHTGMHNYWRTKTLTFNGATISEAIQAIQDIYDVKVTLSNPDIAHCKINVDFENEEIENVLNVIGETLNLVWSNQGDSYLLAGYGCPQ